MQLSLSFWPQSPKLNKQLAEQGLKFDKQIVKKFEQRIEFINKSLLCGEVSHADSFNTAKALADEINLHVQTYVEPEIEAIVKPVKPATKKVTTKKPVKKTATKKATNDKSRSKKTSGKNKRS